MAEEKKATAAAIVDNISISDVYRAAKQLDNVVKKTTLIQSPYFSSIAGNDVYLKPENLQNTGSFKVHGA